MRLGLIRYGLKRALGGIGRYTTQLLRALEAQPLSVTVLHAGRDAGADGAVAMPGAGLLPGLLTVGQAHIAWQARRRELDLVHDPTGVSPLLLTPVKSVTTIHDVIPYIYPQTSTTLDRLIYRLWLPLALQRIHAVLTDSHCSKQDIVRHLPISEEKVSVVPAAAGRKFRPLKEEGIQPTLRRHNIDGLYVLYVGSLTARKNLPRLLQAYAQLRRWCTKWSLVVVGARKWKSSTIFRTVEELQLQDHVHFTGFVEDEDLPALYNGADLFAFPSLYEGFGLPVLEAMACGTPVITSHTSSLPEVAGEAAITIDPYNVPAMAEAMRRVLADPGLAHELSIRGMRQAARFSWQRTARELLNVYQELHYEVS